MRGHGGKKRSSAGGVSGGERTGPNVKRRAVKREVMSFVGDDVCDDKVAVPLDSKKEVRSSRIIVRNIPKHATNEQIRTFFGQEGLLVTDTRIIAKKGGDSRRFCFVGFRSESEAVQAVKRLNKAFIDTSRISVELALPMGHEALPRPWSAHTVGSSAHMRKHPEVYDGRLPLNNGKDVGTRGKKQHVTVQDLLGEGCDAKQPAEAGDEEKEALQNLGDTGRVMTVNLPYSCGEEEIKNFMAQFGEISEVHMPTNDEGSSKGFAYITYVFPEDAVKAFEGLSGKGKGGSRSGRIFQGRLLEIRAAIVKPEATQSFAKVKGNGPKGLRGSSTYKRDLEARKKEAAENPQTWNLLYVSSDAATEAMATELGVSKTDFLDFESGEMAVRVALGETHVIQQTKRWLEQEGINVAAFKRTGPSLMSSKLAPSVECSKDAIIVKHLPFNTSASELREVLSRHGNLQRFCLSPSGTVAIAKFTDAKNAGKAFNRLAFRQFKTVPLYLEWAPKDVFSVEQQKLGPEVSPTAAAAAECAASVGEVKKDRKKESTSDGVASEDHEVVMSSAGGEGFKNRTGGKQAAIAGGRNDEMNTAEQGDESGRATKHAVDDEEEDEDASSSFTLFVKNLNFKTDSGELSKHFSSCEGFRCGTVRTSRPLVEQSSSNPSRNPPPVKSLGYGHVEFSDAKFAIAAMKRMQGSLLDDHAVQLQFSHAKPRPLGKQPRSVVGSSKRDTGVVDITKAKNKLLVRNLAFQATKKELRLLFSACGTVSACRIPKKTDGSNRGYGFVEFATKKEAVQALETMQHTHFYGRHLIIQPAVEETGSTQEAHEKAKKQIEKRSSISKSKRPKLDDGDDGD